MRCHFIFQYFVLCSKNDLFSELVKKTWEAVKYTGFPINDARWQKYEKSTFSIILPSFSLLSRSGIFFSFEKRASFLGSPVAGLKDVSIRCTDVELCQFQTQRSSLFSKIKGSTIQYNNKSTVQFNKRHYSSYNKRQYSSVQ